MAKHDSNFLHLTHIINKFSLYLMISQLVEEQQRWRAADGAGQRRPRGVRRWTSWRAADHDCGTQLTGKGKANLMREIWGSRGGRHAQWKTLRSDESWSLAAGRTRSDEPGRLAAEPRLISGAFAPRRHTTDDCVPLRVFLVVEIMTCQSLQKRSLLGGLNIRW